MASEEFQQPYIRLFSRFEDDEGQDPQGSNFLMGRLKRVIIFEDWILQMEKKIKELRQRSLFKKEPIEITKWTRGRRYSVQNKNLFLTLTNFPEVSYLDLDQFSCSAVRISPSMSKIIESLTWKFLERHPLVECTRWRKQKGLKEIIKNFVQIHERHGEVMLKIEYEDGSWVSLWHEWNARRFSKFLDYNLDNMDLETKSQEFSVVSSSFISILRRHSKIIEPEFIVDCYRRLALSVENRDFLTKMPIQYVTTLLKHSKTRTTACSMFGGHDAWLVDEHLVEHAFMKGNVRRLQVLLQYDCPSVFMPSVLLLYFDEDQLVDLYWPRGKPADGGEMYTSYYSTEYLCYNIKFVCQFFARSRSDKESLHNCIIMLWRSIPTPFPTIEDMREWIQLQDFTRSEKDAYLGNLKYFPKEFGSVYSPRRLKHLCRCALRQRWWSPEDITLLPLPTDMKSYLKMNK